MVTNSWGMLGKKIMIEEKTSGIFLTILCVLLSFWAKIWDQNTKGALYTKFSLNPQQNNEKMKTSSHFFAAVTNQNNDYDVIPLNWRWRHQNFLAIWQDFYPLYIPAKFQDHLNWNNLVSEENPKKTCHFDHVFQPSNPH